MDSHDSARSAQANTFEPERDDDRLQPYRHYVTRAQASIDAARAEPLPHRMRIHLEAARQWTALAEKAAFVARRRSSRDEAGRG